MPARRRNQSDADFRQTHVGLRRDDHVIRTHRDFTTAAERVTVTGGDHRLFKLAQRGRGLLKSMDAGVDVVPLLILNLGGDQHKVGAGRKVLALVADHESREILPHLFERLLQHHQLIAADHIHFDVKFQARHVVAEVNQARTGIAANDFVVFAQHRQADGFFGDGHGNVIATGQVEVEPPRVLHLVKRSFAGRE